MTRNLLILVSLTALAGCDGLSGDSGETKLFPCQARCAGGSGPPLSGNETTILAESAEDAEFNCSEDDFSDGAGCINGAHFDGCSCSDEGSFRTIEALVPIAFNP